ncbi:hypothetical protein [Ammoniphilus sp. 3BR4]|uniref:hypothetical protein n=1 Tax=Ammoniphilus sp. 3BR4 TaxID=3158265 RepID=UPI003465CDC9
MSLANWEDIIEICTDQPIVPNGQKIMKKRVRLQRRVQLENGIIEEFPVKPEIDRMVMTR